MLNLLTKNVFHSKPKNDEKLQIAFDKKFGVERIFDQNLNDIYYIEKNNQNGFQKIGSLFLDYLSDNISEICTTFMEDLKAGVTMNELENKYVSSYIFYFKYFFGDRLEDFDFIKSLSKEEQKEMEKIVLNEIGKIEKTYTLEELVIRYNEFNKEVSTKGTKVTIGNKEIKVGTSTKSLIYIVLKGKLAKFTRFFVERAYIKQLYNFLIDYCYFRRSGLLEDEDKSIKVLHRYNNFKKEYMKLLDGNNDIHGICRLTFIAPPSIASVGENDEIIYTYQIDEMQNIEYNLLLNDSTSLKIEVDYKKEMVTNIFFSISLLNMFETEARVTKCLNCGSYFIKKKEGTIYCNNPSPQRQNLTCSDFMKFEKHKNKIEDDVITKEEKRASDRIRSNSKSLKETNHSKFDKEMRMWYDRRNKQKKLYKCGQISKDEYIKWLKKENRRI